jgi:hypothetical protein
MKKTYGFMAVLGMCVVAMMAGCATGGGMSPEEAVAKKIDTFNSGLKAQDIELIMAPFSENFEHYEYGDKEGIQDFLQQAIDMGYLEGIEMSLEDAEYTQDGGKLSVYPIDLAGAFGSVTMELTFTEEAGGWFITTMDASGM